MTVTLINEKCKLENPTIAQVIEYLSQFPPDAPFRIEDPDTNWTINIIHARQCGGIVWFTGEYCEMNSGPEDQVTDKGKD